ncbi:MAG TPA: hypothetical protein VHV30_06635 [Polyangiaceae bacterium]|jgi:hypothetical protein|nr:hypothetical protein [Polyangiaceae bacterium]
MNRATTASPAAKPAPMAPHHRVYLFVECTIGAAVVNIAINGFLGWLTFRTLHTATLPLWRIPGVAADLVGTAFGVTFGTTLGMGLQVARDMKRGKIGHVDLSPRVAAFIARFPHGTFRRSVGLGVASIVFALPVITVLALLGVDAMGEWPYVTLKSAMAAVQAAAVTPWLVLARLGDVKRSGTVPAA